MLFSLLKANKTHWTVSKDLVTSADDNGKFLRLYVELSWLCWCPRPSRGTHVTPQSVSAAWEADFPRPGRKHDVVSSGWQKGRGSLAESVVP